MSIVDGIALLLDSKVLSCFYYLKEQSIGAIEPASEWAIEVLEWDEAEKNEPLTMLPNSGYELLQGSGSVKGRLMGGCMDVLETAKGTEIWPKLADWEDNILFLEVADGTLDSGRLKQWLRNYGAQGILQKVNGIIFGKPQNEKVYDAYKKVIQETMKELGLEHVPVLYNMNFGHTKPKTVLPYGAMAEINCDQKTFSILENGVE